MLNSEVQFLTAAGLQDNTNYEVESYSLESFYGTSTSIGRMTNKGLGSNEKTNILILPKIKFVIYLIFYISLFQFYNKEMIEPMRGSGPSRRTAGIV